MKSITYFNLEYNANISKKLTCELHSQFDLGILQASAMVIRVYTVQTSQNRLVQALPLWCPRGRNPAERTGFGTSDAELCVPRTQLMKEASTGERCTKMFVDEVS